jgi:hypothetical protein
VLQLLCMYGAQRWDLHELVVDRMPEECHVWIRATWRWTSELHHVELLPPARVRELLAEGLICMPAAVLPTRQRRCPSRERCCNAIRGTRAQLVVRAAAPWSPWVDHSLFPAHARTRAVELFVLGHLLARERPELVIAGGAFVDVWAEHVMPHALARDGRWG